MAIIKEILAAEELEKIAMLLGLKQETLKQYTLQTAKEALQVKIRDLRILEDEKLEEEANNFLTTFNGLTEQDWKDSLNDGSIQSDTSIANTAYLKNPSPLFLLARFDSEDKDLLEKVNKVYNKITGKQPECKLYKSRDQLENDTTLPETVKQALLSKPFSPFILTRLEFDSQKQLDTFLKEIPNKASSKFNTIATSPSAALVQQTETEETQQSNYSTPSPFKMSLTPSIKN
jgi:hypothetical protein